VADPPVVEGAGRWPHQLRSRLMGPSRGPDDWAVPGAPPPSRQVPPWQAHLW
jgi:hypothetical protein